MRTREHGEIATLAAGGYFGELCMLSRRHRRSASIVAKGSVRVATLSAEAVKGSVRGCSYPNPRGVALPTTPCPSPSIIP